MSDYQSVTIKSIEKKVITIEVVEDSHDSRALASIFDEGSRRGIDDGKERAGREGLAQDRCNVAARGQGHERRHRPRSCVMHRVAAA
jgi:hypothetical protein